MINRMFSIIDMTKSFTPKVDSITAASDGEALKKFAKKNKLNKANGWELTKRSTFHELFQWDDEGRVIASYVAE